MSYDAEQKEYKTSTRKATIIEPYRKIFNRKSLPPSKQYWTLCAQQTTRQNKTFQYSEIEQLRSEKLIKEGQFFGVDKVKSIITTNEKAYSNDNWIHGNFINAINHIDDKDFKPGIINFDTINEPKQAFKDLHDIIIELEEKKKKGLMLVLNLVKENSKITHKQYTDDDVIEEMRQQKIFDLIKLYNWNIYNDQFEYPSMNSTTKMFTIIFYKK